MVKRCGERRRRYRWVVVHALVLATALIVYRNLAPRLVSRLGPSAPVAPAAAVTEAEPLTDVELLGVADRWAVCVVGLGLLLVGGHAVAAYARGRRRRGAVPAPGSGSGAGGVSRRGSRYVMLILLLLAAVAYGVRTRRIRSRLMDYELVTGPEYSALFFPELEPEEVMQLGGGHVLHDDLPGSYLKIPRRKPPGVTRIGVFGCSFVQGAEAAGQHNVAALLQSCFDRAGRGDVEVVNFHTSGMGVTQMFLMWEALGKDYALDVVVAMPFRWHRWRDCSFVYPYNAYGPLHARYILRGGDLELMPVLGATRRDACRIYHRILPPLRYVRYDRNLPLFLRALVPSALHDGANPFYYRNPWAAPDREMFDIYGRVLNQWAAAASNLVVVANDEDIHRLGTRLTARGVHVLRSQAEPWMTSFLYHAPRNHNSALGNDLRARELFSLLTGARAPELPVVTLTPCRPAVEPRASVPAPLYEAQTVEVMAGDVAIASVVHDRTHPDDGRYGCDMDFVGTRVGALLALPDVTAKGRLLCLASLPAAETALGLSFKLDGQEIRVPLGCVRSRGSAAGLWIPAAHESAKAVRSGVRWTLAMRGNRFLLQTQGRLREVAVSVGPRTRAVVPSRALRLEQLAIRILLGRASIRGRVFETVPPHSVLLRSKAGHYLDAGEAVGRRGTLDLVAGNREGMQERVPLANYVIEHAQTAPFTRSRPGRHAVLERGWVDHAGRSCWTRERDYPMRMRSSRSSKSRRRSSSLAFIQFSSNSGACTICVSPANTFK